MKLKKKNRKRNKNKDNNITIKCLRSYLDLRSLAAKQQCLRTFIDTIIYEYIFAKSINNTSVDYS